MKAKKLTINIDVTGPIAEQLREAADALHDAADRIDPADELDARVPTENERVIGSLRLTLADMEIGLREAHERADFLRNERDQVRDMAELLNDQRTVQTQWDLPWLGARRAKCGPDCEHNPDGGNHPVVPS